MPKIAQAGVMGLSGSHLVAVSLSLSALARNHSSPALGRLGAGAQAAVIGAAAVPRAVLQDVPDG